jgi:hypothetical protein
MIESFIGISNSKQFNKNAIYATNWLWTLCKTSGHFFSFLNKTPAFF